MPACEVPHLRSEWSESRPTDTAGWCGCCRPDCIGGMAGICMWGWPAAAAGADGGPAAAAEGLGGGAGSPHRASSSMPPSVGSRTAATLSEIFFASAGQTPAQGLLTRCVSNIRTQRDA